MRKTKIKNVDAILTSDWHLREDTPICRTDDFWKAQWSKVNFIRELQRKYDCPVIHAGDLFHHWKPSPYLISHAIRNLSGTTKDCTVGFWTIYGQHDLPQNSMQQADKSGMYTLKEAGLLTTMLHGVNYGETPDKETYLKAFLPKKVMVWHHLTWQSKSPYWDKSPESSAEKILRKYADYDLIVTGDNHEGFVVKKDGRLLVNPGSLTRQNAKQVDYKPRIYLWDAKQNEVEPVYLLIEENVITREHLQHAQERDARIAAFVNGLDTEWEQGLNFEDNLKTFSQANKIRKPIIDLIWKAVENEI